MSLPAFGFHHGGVSVPDLDAAICWYEDMLGFRLERRFEVGGVNAKAAFVRRGAMRFELFEVAGASPLPDDRRSPPSDLRTHGNKHVAFGVSNFEGFLASMKLRGADVAMVVREDFGRGFFIRDCAGNLIEFVDESVD